MTVGRLRRGIFRFGNDADYVAVGNVNSLPRLLGMLAEIAPMGSVLEVHRPRNAPGILEYLSAHGTADDESQADAFAFRVSATATHLNALARLAEEAGAEEIGDVFQNLFSLQGDVALIRNYDGDDVVDFHVTLGDQALEMVETQFGSSPT